MSRTLKNSSASTDVYATDLAIAITDSNGIIVSANHGFEKNSEYKFSELKNKAFSFLIHADMPKVLVKMLWQNINNKQSTVFYVKQKSKSGSAYWSCTSIFQIKNGFIIISIKANTGILRKIKNIYSEILLAENQHLEENDLYKKFEELVSDTFGVANYKDFMNIAFNKEIKARFLLTAQENINYSPSMLLAEGILRSFLSISNSLKNLQEDANALDENIIYCQNFDYSKIVGINPKNTQDFTAQLQLFADHILQQNQVIKDISCESLKVLCQLIFLANTLKLQIETIEYYNYNQAELQKCNLGNYLEPNTLKKIAFLRKLIEQNINAMQSCVKILLSYLEKNQLLTAAYVDEIDKLENAYNQTFNLNQNQSAAIFPSVKAVTFKIALAKEALLNIVNENKNLYEYSTKTFNNCKSFNEQIFKQEIKAKNAFERF